MKLSEAPEFSSDKLQASLPELPEAKRERYKKLNIQTQDIELYVTDIELSKYFEALTKDFSADLIKTASNFLSNDVLGLIKKNPDLRLPNSENLKNIIRDFGNKKINSRQAKDDIKDLVEHNKINIRAHEVVGVSEDVLVEKIIAAHPQSVADYKAGKAAALQFLVGQGMKESKGSANPVILREMFLKLLN
jgi:aspartyl-tRNA(Asn)/glutamyl-tRNA(Gln) amidotransferase subunit B